ncbi:ceramidase domain-containing protein [Chachezhania antarctica]|uniref:ceramidase domain-containing protein n=1 Tax=Chachezhania antarctica TaxID=2340860 RepID=UPI000EAF70F7|nr:ceramidase domain-containing protein [Chachezhania antarctica]|tara:strand:+ start:8299 stop:8985 length:687 start_codon:yes stop_codon:yes gene_type:complete
MNWTQSIDGYCERLDPGFWAEPVNALTNAAFLLAAFIMWRRVRGRGMPLAMGMVWVLTAIGIGSFLFHTFAQPWAGLADTAPILFFILLYIYAANRHFWGLGVWWALAATVAFLPFAALTVPIFQMIPGIGSSAGYMPVPLLIAAYAVGLRHRAPATARGLAIGAGLLVLSLTFRTVDEPVCDTVPLGTHFLWHLLNGLLLGWMIEVYRRHLLHLRAPGGLAGSGGGR